MASTPSTRPVPAIGFRRRARATGEPFLVAQVAEDLTIAAGSELHLRRLHAGNLDSPEFALVVIPPRAPFRPSRTQREQLAAERCDGTAMRRDQRDADGEEAPW